MPSPRSFNLNLNLNSNHDLNLRHVASDRRLIPTKSALAHAAPYTLHGLFQKRQLFPSRSLEQWLVIRTNYTRTNKNKYKNPRFE